LIDLYDKYLVNIIMLLAGALSATASRFLSCDVPNAAGFCS